MDLHQRMRCNMCTSNLSRTCFNVIGRIAVVRYEQIRMTWLRTIFLPFFVVHSEVFTLKQFRFHVEYIPASHFCRALICSHVNTSWTHQIGCTPIECSIKSIWIWNKKHGFYADIKRNNFYLLLYLWVQVVVSTRSRSNKRVVDYNFMCMSTNVRWFYVWIVFNVFYFWLILRAAWKRRWHFNGF